MSLIADNECNRKTFSRYSRRRICSKEQRDISSATILIRNSPHVSESHFSDRNASTYLEFGTGIGPTTTSVAAHSSDADHRDEVKHAATVDTVH